jgi:mycothiol synthase
VPLQLTTGVPGPSAREAVVALAGQVEHADGAPPLSDQALSQLGSDAVTHVTFEDGDELVGYAQRDGDSVEIVAEPQAIDPLLDAVATPPVQIWTHGRRSRLVDSLQRRAFGRLRELHQLRRPFGEGQSLPADPPLAEGVTVRDFVPGEDDAAWLRVNAAAFAKHPEQGRWTETDLRARLDADWFDPAGFLLAVRDGELLGFHWTKMHPDGLGEVYVIGVSPAAQGLGLGNALLVRGLRHLQQRGCPAVLLYVDGDNTAAMRLYERAGFVPFDLDVQWGL